MRVDPGSEGFWSMGEFEQQAPGIDNPWKYSRNKMAPFDKEVNVILLRRTLIIKLNYILGLLGYFCESQIHKF